MTDQAPAKSASPAERRTASIAGWLMLLTFLTSIPASLILYEPILNETDFIVGTGDVGRIQLGALLEIIQVIAQNRGGSRDVPDPAAVQRDPLAQLRRVSHHGVGGHRRWSHQPPIDPHIARRPGRVRGPGDARNRRAVACGRPRLDVLVRLGFCVGVNGILLGWMMYRTGPMPRGLALLGVVGGPLLFASAIAVLFDVYEQDGAHALFSIPEAAFELSFAIYLIVKGFRPSPILSGSEERAAATSP